MDQEPDRPAQKRSRTKRDGRSAGRALRRTTARCCRSWWPTCATTAPSCARSGPGASARPSSWASCRTRRSSPRPPRSTTTTSTPWRRAASRPCRRYARELSERIIPRGVETHEVLGIVLLLRDVLARSLFAKYQDDLELLNRILDAYEPAANRIAVTVGVSFVEERERVIHEQQESLRELSTPVLQLRERLLILPIIGVLDSARARQLTEQLLGAIQDNRAKVVVIDITGVATIDRTVANHLVQTVEASRLMGAQHDPHRPLVGDRPDARGPRRRPRHDEDGRRPPGGPRGGRAAGRLPRRRGRATPAATSRARPARRCR